MLNMRRWILPSGAAQNLRDLGGYACAGGATRFNAVLRSDQLHGLSAQDRQMLVDRGLTDVLDLRSSGERRAFPNDFENHPQVKLHTVVVSHDGDEFQFSPHDYTRMGDMYLDMLDANGAQYARMLGVVAESRGISIVHCMAGKDRTGIVCALLLLALGVDPCDVVADYQVTMTYLGRHIMGSYMSDNPEMPRYLASSEPDDMWMLIRHLDEKHGGAEAYLRKHGLSDAALRALREKLVEGD